jgi:hypothetical protein
MRPCLAVTLNLSNRGCPSSQVGCAERTRWVLMDSASGIDAYNAPGWGALISLVVPQPDGLGDLRMTDRWS